MVTRSITQVLLKVPVDLWLVITDDCSFHRSIARTWWETGIITACGPSLGAGSPANSADGPHLIEFSLTVNSEAALRFNPLSFRAKVRQHKTLSHVSLCLSSLETPPVSTSTSVQQLALHSLGCSDWLQSHRQLRVQGFFFLKPFFTPVWQAQDFFICKYINFAKSRNDVWDAWSFPRRVFMKHHTGGSALEAHRPHVGFFNMTRLSLLLFATHLLIQPWCSILEGASGVKYTTSEIYLVIYRTDRLNRSYFLPTPVSN